MMRSEMNAKTPRRQGREERRESDRMKSGCQTLLPSRSLLPYLGVLASWRLTVSLLVAGAALSLLTGCFGKPNQANIALRKQNEKLQDQITELQQQLTAQKAQAAALQQRMPTVPVLPPERLNNLFTTRGLKFG